MTIEELFIKFEKYWLPILLFFITIPLFTFIMGYLHGKDNGEKTPWKYFYTVIIYLVCVPGVLSLIFTGYNLLFLRKNILALNIITYYLPVISMVITLVIISRFVAFWKIPGLGRLWGFILILSISFIFAFILYRMRVYFLFLGSIQSFFGAAVILFIILNVGFFLLFRKKRKKDNDDYYKY